MAGLSRSKSENQDKPAAVTWETSVAVAFGIVFVVAMLAFSSVYPSPTATQYATYKTVLALAAAGFGAVIPGVIQIDFPLPKGVVRASGAVVLFVIVFFFTPASPDSSTTTINQTANGENATQVGENHGVMNIGVPQEKDATQ